MQVTASVFSFTLRRRLQGSRPPAAAATSSPKHMARKAMLRGTARACGPVTHHTGLIPFQRRCEVCWRGEGRTTPSRIFLTSVAFSVRGLKMMVRDSGGVG